MYSCGDVLHPLPPPQQAQRALIIHVHSPSIVKYAVDWSDYCTGNTK